MPRTRNAKVFYSYCAIFVEDVLPFLVCTDVLTNVMKKVEDQSASVNDQDVIRQALLDYCDSVVGNDDKKEKLVRIS